MEESEPMLTLTPRAKRALGATHSWAYFTGFALFCMALLATIRNVVNLFGLLHRYHAGEVPHAMLVGGAAGLAVSMLFAIGFNAILGWLALRYGNRLEKVKIMERPSADDIAAALGAQQSYWRLQGILMIIGIALVILAVLLVIVAAALIRR